LLELLEDSPGDAGTSVVRHHVHPLDLRYVSINQSQCAHTDCVLSHVRNQRVADPLDRLCQRRVRPRCAVVRSAPFDLVPKGLGERKNRWIVHLHASELEFHDIKLT
jgi:hypothetical protein